MVIVDIREENGYLIVKYYAYTLVYCYAYFSEEENNGWYGHPSEGDGIKSYEGECGIGDFQEAIESYSSMMECPLLSLSDRVLMVLNNILRNNDA
jgi:hypothetical protein